MFGGFTGFGGFGRHIPESDPEIPDKSVCLACDKSDIKLSRCSECKLAMFCNEVCQRKAWKKHKKYCQQLKALFDSSNPHKLEPVRCQIIRYRDGATIKNAKNMVPSEISTLRSYDHTPSREIFALLLGTHDRLGKLSKVYILKGHREIFIKIYSFIFLHPKVQEKRLTRKVKIGGDSIQLTQCAADHMSVIRSLTKDQRNARYPLACKERWGDSLGNHSDGNEDDGCCYLRDCLE